MNEYWGELSETCDTIVSDSAAPDTGQDLIQAAPPAAPAIPDYLQNTYGWAYLHPKSFWFFEHEWVVNLILWGNMGRLTNAVLEEMDFLQPRRLLQVACVYGNFSARLAAQLANSKSSLSIVDVAAIQLQNVRKKLAGHDNVSFHHQDAAALRFHADSFDETVVFFLLHEQPVDVRRKTLAEAIRVTRPGGRVILVDYHKPQWSNPMRYVMKPVLALLEPFAMDLWRAELSAFMPAGINPEQVSTSLFFGGLYQKVVLSL